MLLLILFFYGWFFSTFLISSWCYRNIYVFFLNFGQTWEHLILIFARKHWQLRTIMLIYLLVFVFVYSIFFIYLIYFVNLNKHQSSSVHRFILIIFFLDITRDLSWRLTLFKNESSLFIIWDLICLIPVLLFSFNIHIYR